MRSFFTEGDLVVAEVQQLMAEGSASLHTRSIKYGKLRNGCLVRVNPAIVTRAKTHFYELDMGVDIVVGMNGFIWICQHYTTTEATIYSSENDVCILP